ncbi:MAG: hypothetical protein RLZZ568_2331 [Cyanobacteriota bacterium]
MPGQCNHAQFCRPYLQHATVGYVFGKIYHLPHLGYPGVCEGTDRIWGHLLVFSHGFSLAALDALEDYDPHRLPDYNEYNRSITSVFLEDEQVYQDAWIYRMTPTNIQRHNGIYLPSGRWGVPTRDRGADFTG